MLDEGVPQEAFLALWRNPEGYEVARWLRDAVCITEMRMPFAGRGIDEISQRNALLAQSAARAASVGVGAPRSERRRSGFPKTSGRSA